MNERYVTSVDFGSKKISASVGKIVQDEFEVLEVMSINSKGIKKGFVVDLNNCVKCLKEVLDDLQRKTNFNTKQIYAGISSRGLRISEVSASVNLKDGKVNKKDIEHAIERGKRNIAIAQGEEIVDTIINFYMLDEKVIYESPIGWLGSSLTLNLTVFLGPSIELDKYKEVVSRAGYLIKGFVVNIMSGKEIFLRGKSSTELKVLVDVGDSTTDIGIFKDGIIKYISCIPLGGSNITNDIAICGKFSIGEAEKLKIIYSSNYESIFRDDEIDEFIDIGSTRVSKVLFYEVVYARLEEMLRIINLELKNTSYFDGICSIIIYGDGISYYENINSLVKNEFEKKVKIITNDSLDMKNPENITALAIVKNVYDRVKLVCDNSDDFELVKSKKNLKEKEFEEKEEQEGIFRKLKSFLEDIF